MEMEMEMDGQPLKKCKLYDVNDRADNKGQISVSFGHHQQQFRFQPDVELKYIADTDVPCPKCTQLMKLYPSFVKFEAKYHGLQILMCENDKCAHIHQMAKAKAPTFLTRGVMPEFPLAEKFGEGETGCKVGADALAYSGQPIKDGLESKEYKEKLAMLFDLEVTVLLDEIFKKAPTGKVPSAFPDDLNDSAFQNMQEIIREGKLAQVLTETFHGKIPDIQFVLD